MRSCLILQLHLLSNEQWWEIGPIRDALHHIEDTEGGFAIEDRLGNIALQAAGHRPSRTLAATFTGITALPNEFKVVGKPEREIAVKDVLTRLWDSSGNTKRSPMN